MSSACPLTTLQIYSPYIAHIISSRLDTGVYLALTSRVRIPTYVTCLRTNVRRSTVPHRPLDTKRSTLKRSPEKQKGQLLLKTSSTFIFFWAFTTCIGKGEGARHLSLLLFCIFAYLSCFCFNALCRLTGARLSAHG